MDGLVIWKAMVLRRAFCAVVFVVLFCTFAIIGDSEGKRKTLETFRKNGDGYVTQEMDQKMVWQINSTLKIFINFYKFHFCSSFFFK